MYYIVVSKQEAAMPEGTNSMPVSLRVPADLVETLDKIAAALDRPRSWVMLRALRQYIADEGQEVLDIRKGIAEADRGELIPFDEVMAEAREIIARAEGKRGTS
jgi:predicted transcriptional regulator